MSTFHDDTFIKKRCYIGLTVGRVELIEKPAVQEYNQRMGGVDKGKCDQHTQYYIAQTCQILWLQLIRDPVLWFRALVHKVVETYFSIFSSSTLTSCTTQARRLSWLSWSFDVQWQDYWMDMREPNSGTILKIPAFHCSSEGDPFQSQYQMEVNQSAVIEQQARGTRPNTAKYVKLLSVSIHALRSTTPL